MAWSSSAVLGRCVARAQVRQTKFVERVAVGVAASQRLFWFSFGAKSVRAPTRCVVVVAVPMVRVSRTAESADGAHPPVCRRSAGEASRGRRRPWRSRASASRRAALPSIGRSRFTLLRPIVNLALSAPFWACGHNLVNLLSYRSGIEFFRTPPRTP